MREVDVVPVAVEVVGGVDVIARLVSDYSTAHPNDLEAILVSASALAASDQERWRRQARMLFEHVATVQPRSREARCGLTILAYQDGDLAGAEQGFRAIIAEDPANAQALNDLAWVLQEAHRDDRRALDEALDLAEQAVLLDPGNVHYLDTRGVICSKFPERLHDARTDFEKCARLSTEASRKAKALLRLSRVCMRLGEVVEARRHLELAMRFDQRQAVFAPDERRELHDLRRRLETDGAAHLAP